MTWGLVLSGGTAFGIANCGVIEVLEREGLRPDCIAGSSMGAIVGALWATGCSSERMLQIASSLSLRSIAALDGMPWKGSLHAGILRHTVEDHLSGLLGQKTIGDCEIPFVCVAGRVAKPVNWTQILHGNFTAHLQECIEPYVFPPGTRLIDAVMASTAIPVLFHPVSVGADTFVDLVSFGAIPSKHLRDAHRPDVLVATDTNPQYDALAPFLPTSVREFIDDGFAAIQRSRDLCDLVIRPELTGHQYRFDKAEEFYHKGAEAAEKALPRLRQLLRIERSKNPPSWAGSGSS